MARKDLLIQISKWIYKNVKILLNDGSRIVGNKFQRGKILILFQRASIHPALQE